MLPALNTPFASLNFDHLLDKPEFGGATSTPDGYARFASKENTLSYSQIETLHTCPRRFLLDKQQTVRSNNIDFAMGHAVGEGVQKYLETRDLNLALLAGDIAFDLDYFDVVEKKKKGIDFAFHAIEKFAVWADEMLRGWQVLILPNGKPAIETTFSIKIGKFWFSSHVDIVLQNIDTGELRVFEIKTSGFTNIQPEIYANSNQGLGYLAQLKQLFPQVTDLEVDYLVYSCPNMEWNLLPFVKTQSNLLDWVTDLLLVKEQVGRYFDLGHFPKYGGGCLKFNRSCPHFGICDFPSTTPLERVEDILEVETPDFTFDISDFLSTPTA
jgi:hypothetical protein